MSISYSIWVLQFATSSATVPQLRTVPCQVNSWATVPQLRTIPCQVNSWATVPQLRTVPCQVNSWATVPQLRTVPCKVNKRKVFKFLTARLYCYSCCALITIQTATNLWYFQYSFVLWWYLYSNNESECSSHHESDLLYVSWRDHESMSLPV